MLGLLHLEDLKGALHDTGQVLQLVSLVYLLSSLAAFFLQESAEAGIFFSLFLAVFVLGWLLRRFQGPAKSGLRHAFLTAALSWLLFALVSALPFLFLTTLSFGNAFFESMSAVTGTGMTVMPSDLRLQDSMTFFRSLLTWVGGMGILVLALVGLLSSHPKATHFAAAEMHEEKLLPNARNSMRQVWWIYLGLTVFAIALLWFSGLSPWEALNLGLMGVSNHGSKPSASGFSDPFAGWMPLGNNNYWVDLSLIVIMFLSAISFSVHFRLFKKNEWGAYFSDPEFRGLVFVTLAGILLLFPALSFDLVKTVLHAVSASTGGSFLRISGEEFQAWSDFGKLVLLTLFIIGGSTGSTAGGIKIQRALLFLKSIYWKIRETMLPPSAVFSRKMGGKEVSQEQIQDTHFFVLLFLFFIFAGTVLLTLRGYSLDDSLFTVAAAQSNVGFQTGLISPAMDPFAQYLVIFHMWLGRLEIIPFFAILGILYSARIRGK